MLGTPGIPSELFIYVAVQYQLSLHLRENRELHYGVYHIYENLRPNFLHLTSLSPNIQPLVLNTD